MPTSNAPDADVLWKPADLARFFRDEYSEKTFTNWRSAGYGPPYVKVGNRVFYRPEAVRDWAKSRERNTPQKVA